MSSYTFTKNEPLFPMPPDMPEPGPYYTCLVDMRDFPAFPYDYALYFSSDHHRGRGGIWLYVCDGDPTDSKRYLSYDNAVAAGRFDHIDGKPDANPIFVDDVQGTGHTETPHVNLIDGVVYMTYHKNGIENTQRTLLATSKDGVRFDRFNGQDNSVVLSYDPDVDVGDGHTGYFRWSTNPFPGISRKYVGYSLHGGGDDYHSAIWASDNAVTWERLDILTPIEGYAVDRDDTILIWHEIDPASIRAVGDGEYVAIAGVGSRASGGVARITELYEIFLADDGRTLTRESRRILSVGDGDAPDAEELSSPTSTVVEATTHLIYVGAAEEGSVNTVLGATGRFDPSDLPDPLPESERGRHIHKP